MAVISSQPSELEKRHESYRRKRNGFFMAMGVSWFFLPLTPFLSNLAFMIIVVSGAIFCTIAAGFYQRNVSIYRSGVTGERATLSVLKQLPDSYYVFSDVSIELNGKSSQMDHVIVGPTGVFVCETKHLNGEISGKENDSRWVQTKTGRGGGVYRKLFYNPTKQVGTHVYRLRKQLDEKNISTWVQGMVYFSNPNTAVRIHSTQIPVFSFTEGEDKLLDFLQVKTKKLLTDEKIQNIIHTIKG
jgi:hypothetical protein